MKKKSSNVTIFAILTTLTLVSWVFLEAYQRFYKKDIQTVPANIISPLTPSLDTQYLEELASKKQLTQEEISKFNTENQTKEDGQQTQQNISTESANLNPDSATSSGESR